MKYEPTKEELNIIKSFACTVEAAVEKYQYDLKDFVEKAVTTDIFTFFPDDFTLYIQEGSYIVSKITDELKRKNITILPASEWQKQIPKTIKETAYWIGCLILYWQYMEGTYPQEILKYDIEEIILSYDVLHTQSLEYAIDFIKKEYILQ